MSEQEKKNNSAAATTTTSSTTATATTTSSSVVIQPSYPLEKEEKTNDELAKSLIEKAGSFLKEQDKNLKNELNVKITRLVITLGIVQSHSSRNQLLELIKFFKDKKKYINLDDEDAPFMAFFHFDKEMLKKDIYKDKKQVNNYYNPYENSYSGYYFGGLDLDDKNLESYLNDFANSYHMFVPANLYSSYENKRDTYKQMELAKSKGTFYKYGEGCPPVEGSAYEALAKLIQEMNFDEIYVYNCAYWVSNIPKYKNSGQINKFVGVIQNTYFEGMCELLNILMHTPNTTKKFILDSEFRDLLGRNVYSHKNKRAYKNSKIIEYPFNDTTAFLGGKLKKTRKHKKSSQRRKSYKKRL